MSISSKILVITIMVLFVSIFLISIEVGGHLFKRKENKECNKFLFHNIKPQILTILASAIVIAILIAGFNASLKGDMYYIIKIELIAFVLSAIIYIGKLLLRKIVIYFTIHRVPLVLWFLMPSVFIVAIGVIVHVTLRLLKI